MKLIGRGWQYAVYDAGNGRVIKKYNSMFDAYLVMLKDAFFHFRLPVLNFSFFYNEGRNIALQSLLHITQHKLPQSMFGNPTLLSKLEYEQDYCESLSGHLKKIPTEEGKLVIDKCIAFILMLKENLLMEKNCNIGDNFGITAAGNIILIDIGEVLFQKEEIRGRLKERVWAAPDVLSRIPASLRDYFIQHMDQVFSNI